MRSTFKVLFYVNGSKEKNGIVPIMGRVTINGSVAQFSCKQSIHKDLWDVKGNRTKGKSKESRDINLALDNIKAKSSSTTNAFRIENRFLLPKLYAMPIRVSERSMKHCSVHSIRTTIVSRSV